MAKLVTKKLKTDYPIRWRWPIQVGFLPNTKAQSTIEDIGKTQHASYLTQSYTLNRARLSCNMLFVEGTIEYVIEQISKFPYQIEADVIVIGFPKEGKINEINLSNLEILVHKTQGSGVIIVPELKYLKDISTVAKNTNSDDLTSEKKVPKKRFTPPKFNLKPTRNINEDLGPKKKLSKWALEILRSLVSAPIVHFDNWIQEFSVHLSHNYNIEEAAKEVNEGSSVFVTEKFLTNCKLKEYAQSILKRDKELPKHFEWDIRHIDNLINSTMRSISDDDVKFDGESDVARPVIEMGRVLNNAKPGVSLTEENYEEASAKSLEEARYLQCQILQNKKQVSDYLIAKQKYQLAVRIGPVDEKWLHTGKKNPLKSEFENKDKKPETLFVFFKSDPLEKKSKGKKISIDKYGSSSIAKFDFIPEHNQKEFIGEIAIYHNNRLLQKAAISAFIVNDEYVNPIPPPINIETHFVARTQSANLSHRIKGGASIIVDEDQGLIRMVHGKKEKIIGEIDQGFKRIAGGLKDIIETAVDHVKQYPQDLKNKKTAGLFYELAEIGSSLNEYQNFKEVSKIEGPLQIVSRKGAQFPIEFLYTRERPEFGAPLCPNAAEALKKGQCLECGKKSPKEQAKYVCPLGFLFLTKIIERQHSDYKSEKIVGNQLYTTEPTEERATIQLLKNTIVGISKKIKDKSVILSKIGDVSNLKEADNWTEWTDLIKKSTESYSLVLITHTEDKSTNKRIMEIGGDKTLSEYRLNKNFVKSVESLPDPVVILIGCKTKAAELGFLDFTNLFKDKGAAIVLSNFSYIRTNQATNIVESLFQFFKEFRDGKNEGALYFGKIMLKLRQKLVSEGNIVSMALLAHGDADWKINFYKGK